MTKKEFLNILYEQLSDQMPEAKASAHTQYYHDYIQAVSYTHLDVYKRQDPLSHTPLPARRCEEL